MRIGIDASRAFLEERTGTENYSYQLIKHILELPEASDHQWILYVKSVPSVQYPPNVEIQSIQIPYLWTQLGLAYHTWTDRLDCLWVPAHTLPLLRRPGIKTVVTIHGIEYEYLPSFQNPLQRWYLPISTKYAVHSATQIIAVSEFTKSQLVQRLHADSKKITVIHEGVNQKSQIPKLESQEVLKKYALLAKRYLLFIGTVQPRKNIERLIKSYMDIENKLYDLVIIGKLGWGYDALPINKFPNIKFLKYVSDQERDVLLRNALVYVQPSITEGFGLPILEAFAAGIPVVSSSGGALAEVVGEAGLLFDPFNIVDIKNQLVRVVHDSILRKKLVAIGKRRLQQFSWEKAARATYNILIWQK